MSSKCPGYTRHWFAGAAKCDRCGAPNPEVVCFDRKREESRDPNEPPRVMRSTLIKAVVEAARELRRAKSSARLAGNYFVADIAAVTAADNALFAALDALDERERERTPAPPDGRTA